MMTWHGIVLIVFSVLAPFVALGLERRFAWARLLGSVLMCCGFGIIVANQPWWVPGVEAAASMADAAKLLMQATIPLAIPLLLFQAKLTDLRDHGKASALAFGVSALTVVVAVSIMTAVFGDRLELAGHIGGMVICVYIGGVPNLVAVQRAIEASSEHFALVQAATMLVSSVYLVFLLTLVKPLLRRFYPAHRAPEELSGLSDEQAAPRSREHSRLGRMGYGVLSLGASALCVGLVAGLVKITTGALGSLEIILGITTLSIIGSLWTRLREIPTHEAIGMYLILVFCVAAGSSMDVARLLESGSVVLTFTALSAAIFLPLHYLSCRLAGIDLDTTVTMSVATMFGPPFVPPVVQALGNRAVLLPGMTFGFLGYALGTYLGIAFGLWW